MARRKPEQPEATIEKWLVREVEKRGGLCYKFVSPLNPGVPDRIVITPDGKVIFVELKAPFGRVKNLQIWQKERMQQRCADVRVVRGLEQAKEFIQEVFTA